MVCSEAKAAAVSDFSGKLYSEDLPQVPELTVLSLPLIWDGAHTLTDASGHSKLGELIGKQ